MRITVIVTALLVAAIAPAAPAEEPAIEADAFSDDAFESLKKIRSVDAALLESKESPPLARKLLAAAKDAYSRKEYSDALGIATQAMDSLMRSRRLLVQKTPAASPTIDAIIDAMARLTAAEASGSADPRIPTARELVITAEAALAAGKVTQAEQFARRASEILAGTRTGASGDSEAARLDVNAASPRELLELPGMTEEMAASLIWFREHIGKFRSVDEIRFIPGFTGEFVAVNGWRLKSVVP